MPPKIYRRELGNFSKRLIPPHAEVDDGTFVTRVWTGLRAPSFLKF